ncbi:hypothetical protein F4782DRAFT_548243 [Xylaria castorea]|nr:hypothetical protein F4782DRAFT_548243 [Xylaria castorea]
MRGINALMRGLVDPRAGLNILRELVFNGQAGLVEAPPANIEVTPLSFISAVFNWVLFGPLLYLVAAPAYFVYSVLFFAVADYIDVGASIKYAFTQTFHFVTSISHIFFLTGFALQTVRVFLLAGTMPEEALIIKYLERLLNIFFSLCTIFVGAPRWVRQPPGKDNPIWLIFALIAICFIANDVKEWSPAWITTASHFVTFVSFAGPTKRKVVDPNLVQLGRREVYQKQALLIVSLLGLSLAITQTAEWPSLYRWVVVVTAAVVVIIMLDVTSRADAQTLYVDDPNDERLQPTRTLKREYLSLSGSIIVSILMTLMIGDWPWHQKWPLIISLSFVAFLITDVYKVMAGGSIHPIVQLKVGANDPPGSLRQADDDYEHSDSSDDPERDPLGAFVDRFGRPIDPKGDERLPEVLTNIGPFPTNDELALLFWYRYRLRARLSRTDLLVDQQVYVAERVFAMIPPEDIARSSYYDDVLEQYINRALQYEMENNPDF